MESENDLVRLMIYNLYIFNCIYTFVGTVSCCFIFVFFFLLFACFLFALDRNTNKLKQEPKKGRHKSEKSTSSATTTTTTKSQNCYCIKFEMFTACIIIFQCFSYGRNSERCHCCVLLLCRFSFFFINFYGKKTQEKRWNILYSSTGKIDYVYSIMLCECVFFFILSSLKIKCIIMLQFLYIS